MSGETPEAVSDDAFDWGERGEYRDDGDDEPADITDLAHQRGSDGQLLPVERTVTVRGEGEATLEVIPATTGQRNEWEQRLEDAGEEIDGELRADLFDEFLPYGPEDFGCDEWADIRPALDDALGTAIFAEIFDVQTDNMDRALARAMDDVGGEAGEGN